MPCEFGDIVIVEYPFGDGTESKRRPAVVINQTAYAMVHEAYVLVPVTSQVKLQRGFDLRIRHWRAAGLLRDSLVKPVLFTVSKYSVERKLGTLQNDDRDSLRKVLGRLLHCA